MKNVIFSIASFGILLFNSSIVLAEDVVDTTFATNGKATERLDATHGRAIFNALLIQDDDKIIAAGSARDQDNYDVITLYRYDRDGSKDLSFGTGGISTVDHRWNNSQGGVVFDRGGESVVDAAFQSDGKIILAQTSQAGENGYNHHTGFGITRLTSDGLLDNNFGALNGFGYLTYNGLHAAAVAIQNDDKIIVAGHRAWDGSSLALVRFTAEGKVDDTFGTNGIILTDTYPPHGSYGGDSGSDVAVQADGKIVVVGSSAVKGCGDEPDSHFTQGLLLRYNTDGTLDNTFSGDGVVKFTSASVHGIKPWDLSQTYPCMESTFKSVEIQADGKIVVMGQGINAAYSIFLVRFKTDGSLDTSFGNDGVVGVYDDYDYETFNYLNTQFTYNGQDVNVENMKLLKDDSIAISGHFYWGSDYYKKRFMALHFSKNGRFDRQFGTDGIATVNVNFTEPEDEFLCYGANAFDLVEQSSGKIVLGGYASGYYNGSYGVVVRLPLYNSYLPTPSLIMYLLN